MIRNDDRDGLFSYMKLHQWLTQTSGLCISDRRSKASRPAKVKREEDIFGAILEWEQEVRELERVTGEIVMSEGMKKFALKEICTGKMQEEVDLKEESMTLREEVHILLMVEVSISLMPLKKSLCPLGRSCISSLRMRCPSSSWS